ncbi:MAG: hypothetical protein JSW27_03275 [Phycisphaerales bacterium]|nr:MAG: hypothetical protein JSW27_03275 [Phycisphaerales bacterium]
MLFILKRGMFVVWLVAVMVSQSVSAAPTSDEAVDLLARPLDENQVKEGSHAGVWDLELSLMGPITGGMACAYEWTENPDYWTAAELGGYYILWIADVQGNLLGDEAYCFVQLSEASDDPASNVWRSALDEWYFSMRRPGYEESTWDYLDYFEEMDPSTAVFYIAQHAVGAYYVDDIDKKIWRQGLIKYLSRVDDESSFPVMALGVATWALAEIGALDGSAVSVYHGAKPYWDGVSLRDLPSLLASHQVPEGEPFASSFYWRFDHTSGGTGGVVAGYTEDSIYGTLGLVGVANYASRKGEPNAVPEEQSEVLVDDLDNKIGAAQSALLEGIDEDGQVYQHLSLSGESYDTYAGEMLQVLWSVKEYLDAKAEAEAGLELEIEAQ